MKNIWNLCVCAVLKHQDKYLIVKRDSKDNTLPDLWEFPSGGVDFGESLDEALVREIKEEIGIDLISSKKTLIGISEYKIKKQNLNKYTIQINYLYRLDKLPKIKLSEEHSAYDWVKSNDPRMDDFLKKIIKYGKL
jgi:8-oxo-dGTP diphosphatase